MQVKIAQLILSPLRIIWRWLQIQLPNAALSPTKIRTNLEIWLLFARNLAAFLFFAANGGAVLAFARRAADFSAHHLPLRSVGIACGSH